MCSKIMVKTRGDSKVIQTSNFKRCILNKIWPKLKSLEFVLGFAMQAQAFQ